MADEKDKGSKASEFVRKVLTVGMGAVFLTEESLRSMVAEFKLPKELLVALLESANKTRREFFQGMSDEVISRIVNKVNVKDLVQEFMRDNEMELQIKVKFTPRK